MRRKTDTEKENMMNVCETHSIGIGQISHRRSCPQMKRDVCSEEDSSCWKGEILMEMLVFWYLLILLCIDGLLLFLQCCGKKTQRSKKAGLEIQKQYWNISNLVLYVVVFSYLLLSFPSTSDDDDTGGGSDGHDNSELAWPSVRSHNILTLVVPPAHTELGKSGFEIFAAHKHNELQSS